MHADVSNEPRISEQPRLDAAGAKVAHSSLAGHGFYRLRPSMSVPSFVRFIEPVLRYLHQCPEPVPARDVQEAAAAALGLSAEDKAEVLRSGTQAVFRTVWGGRMIG